MAQVQNQTVDFAALADWNDAEAREEVKAVEVAEAAAEAAREEAEEVARQERAAKERDARLARRRPLMLRLAAALGAHIRGQGLEGYTVNHDDVAATVRVNGVDAGSVISEDQVWSSGYRSRVVNTKITVGFYGERRSFPMKKDGSYSWDKIAAETFSQVRGVIRRQAAEAQEQANRAAAQEVANEAKLERYGAVRIYASQDAARPVTLKFELNRSFTKEQALAVLAALKSVGVA